MTARTEGMRKNTIVIALFSVILFNTCYNLSNFPTFFWDQGVYIERGINFIQDSIVYDDPTYIDHPPLGWIIPSLIFKAVGFPDSVSNIALPTNSDLNGQIMLLFLIPRLIAVAFTMIIAVLIYKIAIIMYGDRNLAIVSLTSFSAIPALWPFRNMLLDPIMITFVLLSLFLLVSKNSKLTENQISYTKKFWSRLLISGLLFGVALLVKLTAIFFLPAILIFALGYNILPKNPNKQSTLSHSDSTITVQFSSKQKIEFVILWLIPVFGCLASWVLYFLIAQHTLHNLISTQLWQIERTSVSPAGFALPLLLMASPMGTIFGVFGLARTILNKEKRIWSTLGVPYLAFLFRGGYVGWVHTIPLLPFLSIYAGKPLFQLAELIFCKLQRNKNPIDYQKITNYLVISILIVSVIVTIWVASFDEAGSDQNTIKFLVDNIPQNSLLVTDPGYGWVIKLYRPDLDVINYYLLNKMISPPASFYIAQQYYPSKYDPTLQKLDPLYNKSCLIKTFENNPSFFHPYAFVNDKWWNVQILYYDDKGCTSS
jgi:hypothetical protein